MRNIVKGLTEIKIQCIYFDLSKAFDYAMFLLCRNKTAGNRA